MAAAQPFVPRTYPLRLLQPSFEHITLFLCVTFRELPPFLSLSVSLSLSVRLSLSLFLCLFYYF